MDVDGWIFVSCVLPGTIRRRWITCSWGIGSFWGLMNLQFALNTKLTMKDAIRSVKNCFLSVVCDWNLLVSFNAPTFHLQSLPIMGFRYWWNFDFTCSLKLIVWYNWYVLVMIEQSKWLKLVPLLDHKNEGASYAFLGRELKASWVF
jgi:hypothetical protein